MIIHTIFIVLTLNFCHGSVNSLFYRDSMASVPLGISLGDGQLDIEGVCHKPGILCENCTHAVTCIEIPHGYLKVPFDTCGDGETCNAKLQGCSSTPVPECEAGADEFEHLCEQVGIFPDPYDCRKFHMCAPSLEYPRHDKPAVHHIAMCPRNYGFDPLSAQCKIPLQHGQCDTKLVKKCARMGQNEAIPGSPSHYYVCFPRNGGLYPQLFLCPYGRHYINGFCVDPNDPDAYKEREAVVIERIHPLKAFKSTTTTTTKENLVKAPRENERVNIFQKFRNSVEESDLPEDKALLDRFGVSGKQYTSYNDIEQYTDA